MVLENFKFREYYFSRINNRIRWVCTAKSCTAEIFTDTDVNLLSSNLCHNHQPRTENVAEKQMFRVACKRKALDDISQRPSKIIRCEISQSDDGIEVGDLKSGLRAIHYTRRKLYPTEPRDFVELHQALDAFETVTTTGEQFLLENDIPSHVVIFSCKSNLELLCNPDVILLADGTFTYCPRLYLQLYTVHAFYNHHYLPLAFGLLPGKSAQVYRHFWSSIKRCAEETFNLTCSPKRVFFDFEAAAISGFKEVFPDVPIKLCRFHLSQSLYRKIGNLHLVENYKARDVMGKWLVMFFGLSLVTPEEVEDCYAFDIMPDLPDDDRTIAFADYFLETYIHGSFPPHLWAEPPLEAVPRTTNGAEAFHSHFRNLFTHPHPGIFVFFDAITKIQSETYIKLRSIDTPKARRVEDVRKDHFAMQQYNRFQTGETNRKEFLRIIGNRLAPSN